MENIDNSPVPEGLRDKIAIKAMHAIIRKTFAYGMTDNEVVATYSYNIADAMLAARMKPNKEE